jgi:hypothetical protein
VRVRIKDIPSDTWDNFTNYVFEAPEKYTGEWYHDDLIIEAGGTLTHVHDNLQYSIWEVDDAAYTLFLLKWS